MTGRAPHPLQPDWNSATPHATTTNVTKNPAKDTHAPWSSDHPSKQANTQAMISAAEHDHHTGEFNQKLTAAAEYSMGGDINGADFKPIFTDVAFAPRVMRT